MIWWIMIAKVLFSFTLGLTILIFLVWGERKVLADFQQRIGPDRAGPWGMLQTVADGLKTILQRATQPDEHQQVRVRVGSFPRGCPGLPPPARCAVGQTNFGGAQRAVHHHQLRGA